MGVGIIMSKKVCVSSVLLLLMFAGPILASEITGTAKDMSGGVLRAARVTVQNLATNQKVVTTTDAAGTFRVDNLTVGSYLVLVEREGFSPDARTIEIADGAKPVEVNARLVPGGVAVGVTVTAARGDREGQQIPLRTDTLAGEALQSRSPLSTGDALVMAPGVTPVGSGPIETRPRVRGLDSTRLLVLVDGERLNNARTATARSGTDVGLIDRRAHV